MVEPMTVDDEKSIPSYLTIQLFYKDTKGIPTGVLDKWKFNEKINKDTILFL